MLKLVQLNKAFGGSPAVRDLSLELREGEFFSLLGPSGCGKTTLLRMLAGFESPDSGRIELQDQDITALPPNRRPFNLVFQKYALFPHLNVWQNVAFGLRMQGAPKSEIVSRVDQTLALVQMEGFDHRAVQTLSGGQAQRIALARALINRPSLLLLDEPLSALDLKLRQQMQVELLQLQRRLERTFVFVTHDQDEAMALSDRIGVMNEGRLEQVGTPREIYDRPATPFVASFIGSMNLVPSGALVRPERMRLAACGANAGRPSAEVRVLQVVFQGPLVQYRVRAELPSGTREWLVARASDLVEFAIGEKAEVSWDPADGVSFGT